MATFNELIYMVSDKLKATSDDFSFTEDHILFLINYWRVALLKQRYTDVKKDIPASNYQTIELQLHMEADCIHHPQYKSNKPLPDLVNLNGGESTKITPVGDLFNNIEFSFVNNARFSYVGNNKWLKRIVYFTLGTDQYIYLKSMNPDFKYLQRIAVTGLFSDPVAAIKNSCVEGNCDYLNTEYPLEADLVTALLGVVTNDLSEAVYRPEDSINNANDDLNRVGAQK